MVENIIPGSILIDNTRLGNEDSEYLKLPYDLRFLGTRGLERALNMDLSQASLINRRAGDGTAGAIINNILNHYDGTHPLPVIYLDHGGSAQSLKDGLKSLPKTDTPSNWQNTFPADQFEARGYRPLKVQSDQKTEYAAYIAGFDNLTVASSIYKEFLVGENHPILRSVFLHRTKLAYILGGGISILNLLQRIEPERASYKIGDITYDFDEDWGAFVISTLPNLATFKFAKSVPEDKVRLLTLGSSDRITLSAKYLMALVIGGVLKNGPDCLVKMGIINLRDVDEVHIIMPEEKRKNCCIDGEIKNMTGKAKLSRAEKEKELTFIFKS